MYLSQAKERTQAYIKSFLEKKTPVANGVGGPVGSVGESSSSSSSSYFTLHMNIILTPDSDS